MMDEKILEKIGLTPGEVKVYLTLLKLKTTTTGPLVEESHISKSKAYEILERLTKKGIVSQIKEDGIKHFQATEPRRLLALYEEKEAEMHANKKLLQQTLPELEASYHAITEKQEISVFRGYNGLKSIFMDIIATLNTEEEYLVFCAVEPPESFKGFLKEFSEQRIRKKIKEKIICNDQMSKTYLQQLMKESPIEVKTIFPEFNTPAVFNLYGNKTALLLWSKAPLGIIIENSEITNSFRQYQTVLWNLGKIPR
jgi:HTH-type transcriptional regulator, sugar sensing transcriptional regulator